MRGLLNHRSFSMSNPNRVRSLIGAFASSNPAAFHAEDGSGYQFLVEMLTELNQRNPQVASRLIEPLIRLKRYDEQRDRRLRELARRLDTYQNGNVQMGEALHELRAVVAPLPEKLIQLEQRDPTSLSFNQAARLVSMGASVDELTQACGLTQAEAELMSKMYKG